MKRIPLTARNLRILQIGIILAVCLALVLAAVWGGNCEKAGVPSADARAQTLMPYFHATALQESFRAAGFLSNGNLYAYTLVPGDGSAGVCRVSLSTANTNNDTLTLHMDSVRAVSDADSGALATAYAEKTAEMRAWQTAIVDALLAAVADTGAEPPAGLCDGVRDSWDDGKAYADKTDTLAVEGGYTDAEDANAYVLTVQLLPAK